MALDVTCYERTNDDVNAWAVELSSTFRAKGILIIETSDLVQENASVVILPTDGFLSFCEATRQPVVFLYKSKFDFNVRIQSTIADICETEEDPTLLIRAFETQNALIVKRARTLCPSHFFAEMFVLHQGSFVTAGVLSQPFEDLMNALVTFCESAEDRRAEAKEAQEAMNVDTLEQLAKELMVDPDFVAIRGKRKRCVYVNEKYGLRVPRSVRGEMRRVDQNSDPMDANLVSLVEGVTDRLDLART
jgi:hypothetical protein